GDKVMGIRIVSPLNGRVDITGNVPSAEDKLLISKALKKVNGCTQIVNKVNATGRLEPAAVVKNAPSQNMTPQNVSVHEPVTKPVNATAKAEPAEVVKNPSTTNTAPAKVTVQEPTIKPNNTSSDVANKSTPAKSQSTSTGRADGIAIIPPPPKSTKK